MAIIPDPAIILEEGTFDPLTIVKVADAGSGVMVASVYSQRDGSLSATVTTQLGVELKVIGEKNGERVEHDAVAGRAVAEKAIARHDAAQKAAETRKARGRAAARQRTKAAKKPAAKKTAGKR